jgi:hypothetical protein
MITNPLIARVPLLRFRSSDGGGNTWEFLDEGKYLRFLTYPAGTNNLPQVVISEELKNGGFTHLATIHFRNEGNDMKAADISFGGSQKYSLDGENSFVIGKTCFSREWNDHSPTFRENFVMTWNSERPPRETAMYSAKEATINCIRTVGKYREKTFELD